MHLTIISGGQTGVDRAALDVALELDLPCGGWCPKGRRAEDGIIPERYPLRETPLADYSQRTEWNARDTDATLVLTWGPAAGGTALTIELAKLHGKPCLEVDLAASPDAAEVRAWLNAEAVRTLNVAGPRASAGGEGYQRAVSLLRVIIMWGRGGFWFYLRAGWVGHPAGPRSPRNRPLAPPFACPKARPQNPVLLRVR